MQTISIKNALLAVSLLATGMYAGSAAAHSYGGPTVYLGTAVNATDLYQVSCFDENGPPHHLDVYIMDSTQEKPTPNPIISAQVYTTPTSTSAKITSTTDLVEDTASSPKATIIGGAGPYFIAVDHSRAGGSIEHYTITYHCMTSNGTHTGTTPPPLPIRQNQ